MTPDALEQQTASYLDGTLTPEGRAAFEDALARDPHAAAYVAGVTRGMRAVRALDVVPAPPDFLRQVRARLRRGRRRPWFAPAGLRPADAITLILILAQIAAYLLLLHAQGPLAP